MESILINVSDELLRSDELAEAELAERIAHSGVADHIIKSVFRENGPLADEVIKRRDGLLAATERGRLLDDKVKTASVIGLVALALGGGTVAATRYYKKHKAGGGGA